jgi:hypothetical protein
MKSYFYSDRESLKSGFAAHDPFHCAVPCWAAGPLPRDYVIPSFPAVSEHSHIPPSAGHPAQSASGVLRGKDLRRRA